MKMCECVLGCNAMQELGLFSAQSGAGLTSREIHGPLVVHDPAHAHLENLAAFWLQDFGLSASAIQRATATVPTPDDPMLTQWLSYRRVRISIPHGPQLKSSMHSESPGLDSCCVWLPRSTASTSP